MNGDNGNNKENIEKFMALARSIQRPGMEKLLSYLAETDFFTAPASTKYHGAIYGGLLDHSLTVERMIMKIMNSFFDSYNEESARLVALFHDLCKVNFYTENTRNVKNEKTGQWEKVPFYSIDDQFPAGHGEKSVMIVQKFISLTDEEIMAINWHMAGFDDRAKSYAGGLQLSSAMGKYYLVTALHMADLTASYWAGGIDDDGQN